MIAPVLRRKGSVGLHTFTTPCTKPSRPLIRLRKSTKTGFRPCPRVFFGFTKGYAPARTCVHFCRHGLRRTVSLHFLRAVHNLLFSRNLQSGSGEASFRPLRWGLDVSGILQSRQEDRCNPHTSPPSPVQNSLLPREFGSAGILPAFFPLNSRHPLVQQLVRRTPLTSTSQLGPCVALQSLC
jgi:hypothetical protein